MLARRSVFWAFFFQGVTFIVSFGGSMILARLLSPAEMGINAIAVAALGVTQVVATFGLSGYIVRDPDLQPRTLDLVFSVNAVLALLLSAVLGIASLFSEVLLGDARAGDVMRLLMLGPVINIFGFRSSAMLQREMRFLAISMVTTSMAVTTALLTVLFAWWGASYMSASYAGVAAALVGSIGYVLAAPHHSALRVTFTGWRELARFGFQIMSISGIAVLGARLSDIILGRVLGITALGLYSRASLLANLLFENVYGLATRIAFAKLAHDFRERGELRSSFLQALTLILALMWPIEIGLAVLSKPAIAIIFGERWLAAAAPLSILLTAQAIALSFGMNWELFVLRHETATQARLEIKRAVFGFAVFASLCQFGLASAALGRVGDAVAGYMIYRRHVHRLADIKPREIRRVYLLNGVLTLAAALPAFVMMTIYDWSANPPLLALTGSVLLGIVTWFIGVVVLRHPVLAEAAAPVSRISTSLAAAIRRRAQGSRA